MTLTHNCSIRLTLAFVVALFAAAVVYVSFVSTDHEVSASQLLHIAELSHHSVVHEAQLLGLSHPTVVREAQQLRPTRP